MNRMKSAPIDAEPAVVTFGPFRLDANARALTCDGQPVALTPKNFETLLLLVRNADRVVLKSELIDALWPDAAVEENNLNQQISAVRKALGEKADEARYIRTVPGHGYRFIAPLTAERPAFAKSHKQRMWIWPLLIAAIALTFFLARRSATPGAIRSIAILPFRSLNQADDAYLGLGLTDVLITRLSNVRGMVVRPTSAVLRSDARDPVAAGRALQVDSVLEGTVQRSGDRVRVTARLLSVRDGVPIWGDTFDEQFVDFFSVEDSICERLARALALRLPDAEQRRLTQHDTTNPEAHQWYLRGRYASSRWTAEGFRRSVDSFQHAIDADPAYALAYAGLAHAYYRASTVHLKPEEAIPRARVAAMQAIRLDDSLAEGHSALGIVKFRYDWDFAGAEKEFRRAVALNPDDPTAHQWYSEYLTAVGRVDASVAEAKAAAQIDPLSADAAWNVGFALLFGGRAREAIAQLKNAVDLDPDLWLTHAFLAWSYGEAGEYDRALAEYQKALALDANDDTRSHEAWILAKMGRRDEAKRIAQEMEARSRTAYVSPFFVGAAYAAAGDRDSAFAWLDKALGERSELLVFAAVAPNFAELRNDPRFVTLVRRVAIPR